MVSGISLRKLNVRWLGKLPYSEAYDLQLGLHKAISNNYEDDDYLLLLEHDNVITSGRSSKDNNLLVSQEILDQMSIDFFETDRGGDITFHGEGQLIGYPIIRLQDPKKVVPFVRSIENVLIQSLKELSIDSYTKEHDTGVWTSMGKIASIGIKVSKWTTYHGFSLNIFDKLEGFDLINPCGNEYESVTSTSEYSNNLMKLLDTIFETSSKETVSLKLWIDVTLSYSLPQGFINSKPSNLSKMFRENP